MAQVLVDQTTLPTTGDVLTTYGLVINGGTIYTEIRQSGSVAALPPASVFVANALTPPVQLRSLALTDAKSDGGIALTGTAVTSGAMAVARTAGTSLELSGFPTSSGASTNTAMWEFSLPSTYPAGAAIPLEVQASISGSGTLTAASCTLTPVLYTESQAGVEAVAGAVTPAAGTIAAAGSVLDFSIAGAGLTPYQRVALELTMLVTSSSGANTGHIGSVIIQA